MTTTPARRQATTALLDAAEKLLVEVGHADVTVRAAVSYTHLTLPTNREV